MPLSFVPGASRPPFTGTQFEEAVASAEAGGGAPTPTPANSFGKLSVDIPLAANGDWFSNQNNTNPPPPGDRLTLARWLRPTDVGSGLRKVIDVMHNGTNAGFWWERNSSKMRFFVNGGGTVFVTSTLSLVEVTSTIPLWQFCAVSYVPGSPVGTVKFYHGVYSSVGGLSLTIETHSVGFDIPTYTSASHYQVGGKGPGFNGVAARVCEGGMWSEAQTDTVMQELYNGGKGLSRVDFSADAKASLILWHKMDELSGTLVDAHDAGPYNLPRVNNAGTDVVYAQLGPNP